MRIKKAVEDDKKTYQENATEKRRKVGEKVMRTNINTQTDENKTGHERQGKVKRK